MARCQSCYGIIGVDCFNPEECAWITMRMQANKEREQENRIREMERIIRELESQEQTIAARVNAALEAKP